MAKLYSEQFSGAGVPKGTYYKQTIGFQAVSLLIFNNSPVTYTIRETPLAAPAAILPAFFSMGISLPGFEGLALVGDGTAPFATSNLSFQLQDQPLGSPFGGQFGPNAWGSGGVPNVLTNVNPGDQILAWQVQQIINLLTGVMTGQAVTIANDLNVQGAVSTFRIYDRDGLGFPDAFNLDVSGGTFFIQSNAGSFVMKLLESGTVEIGNGLGLQLDDQDGVGSDYFNVLVTGGLFQLSSSALGQVALQANESGDMSTWSHVYPGNPGGGRVGLAGLLSGTGVPNNANGNNGDFYFNLTGGAATAIYQKRAGSWVGIV